MCTEIIDSECIRVGLALSSEFIINTSDEVLYRLAAIDNRNSVKYARSFDNLEYSIKSSVLL